MDEMDPGPAALAVAFLDACLKDPTPAETHWAATPEVTTMAMIEQARAS